MSEDEQQSSVGHVAHDSAGVSGVLIGRIEVEHPERVVVEADRVAWEDGVLLVEHHNAFVNTGLQAIAARYGALGTLPAAPGWIFLGSDTAAVTAATTFAGGAAALKTTVDANQNGVIKAFSPALALSGATLTGGATFTNADFFNGVPFVWNKIGWLNKSTDDGTALQDVIGGTGGTSPYARSFSLDLRNAGQINAVMQLAVTMQAL